ncbi:MAG: hypothetical protein HN921_09015 [Bacteroidetes bacterium]|jgi:DNA polymerase III subunit epsilon|nr:hypothetical protein [Bacteroidota bacterium]
MSLQKSSTKERVIQEAQEYIKLNPVFIDTETTGFKPDDEIVDISIVDHDGTVLFDSLVNPKKIIPIDAINIHHISNDMVSNAPNWKEVWDEISYILSGRVLGVYNAEYDLRLMKQSTEKWGLNWIEPYAKSFCVMELFAEYYGEWDDYHGNYKWQKLEFAGKYFNINIPNTHRAKDDTLLTREVLIHIAGIDLQDGNMKTCPNCAEEIKKAAIVCKHCKSELPGFNRKIKELYSKDNKSAIGSHKEYYTDKVEVKNKVKEENIAKPIIINESPLYRERTYNTIGNYPQFFNGKFNFFPKIQLEDPDFEKYIYTIETNQKFINPFYSSLIIENLDEFQNNSFGFGILENEKGKWRKSGDQNNLYLVNLISLVSKGELIQRGQALFDVEYSQEGTYIYDSILPDTIVGFRPDEARIINRNNDYRYGKLLEFSLDCILHVFDPENFESEPYLKDVIDFLEKIIPIAKNYGSLPIDPYDFKTFAESQDLGLVAEYNRLLTITKNMKRWFNDVQAILIMFEQLFSSHLKSNSILLNCRLKYKVRDFEKELKEKGFKTPSMRETIDDPIKKLVNDRIWYAGQLKEMEWQANHLAKMLITK